MAIVRQLNNSDPYLTYLSSIALFCGITCTIVMIKFKWFRASLNVSSGKGSSKHYELAPQVSVEGAYRTSREEYFGNINYLDARKIITPSMVKLPPSTQVAGNIKSSKSTADLTNVQNVPAEIRNSTPNVNVPNASQEVGNTKDQLKQQKKLEKERLIQQKKREKLAAQEREKQEKLQKERDKQAAQQEAKEAREREKQRKKKGIAPHPQQQVTVQQKSSSQENPNVHKKKCIAPQPQQETKIQQRSTAQETPTTHQKKQQAPLKGEAPPPPQFKKVGPRVQPNANPLSQRPVQNARNSLESSISRSSGPPPYSDNTEVPHKSDNAGNISFGKPAEESSSWDMISQHRQQMSRTTGAAVHNTKQKNMDLQYNVGNLTNENDRDNSDA